LILPGHEVSLVKRPKFSDVFDAVRDGQADVGLVAYRNNVAGRIAEVYKLLRSREVSLLRAMDLGIEQFLVSGVKGITLDILQGQDEITVASHEMALKQVEGWLDHHLPHAIRVEEKDTAGAIQEIVKRQEIGHLAVGGAFAAEMYGGYIIPTGKVDKKTGERKIRGIQDDKENTTRFMLFGRPDSPLVGALYRERPPTHGVMIFTANDEPGSLRSALEPLDLHRSNMVEIDSRPTSRKDNKTKFEFFVDYEIPEENDPMLQQLHDRTQHMRHIGYYTEMPPRSSREF
jgi:prephenate dehydratase